MYCSNYIFVSEFFSHQLMVREERIRKAAKLKAARNAAKAAAATAHKHALKAQQEPKTEVTFG